MTIDLPVRIDFLGGWSDQSDWKYEAAVINASIGWEKNDDSLYPIRITEKGVKTKIQGIGTGLGISSIIEAGKFLLRNPNGDYIQPTLKYEQEVGIKGGWQDQIGGIEPGFKLITTHDHKNFNIEKLIRPDILNHLILFDTGVRRSSKVIGDKIRELMNGDNSKFIKTLKKNVATAKHIFGEDAKKFALSCIEGWEKLNEFVPMDIKVHETKLVWGHKLCGAGGGGYGIYFVKYPEDRKILIDKLKSIGLWATIPVVLEGIKYS